MNALQTFVVLCLSQGMRPSDIVLQAECELGAPRAEALATLQSITAAKP